MGKDRDAIFMDLIERIRTILEDEFFDELLAIVRPALPRGHSGSWGESPFELVVAIIDERDELRDELGVKRGNRAANNHT